ncbi:MAG: acetamidase/formamidase family protein [Oscillospiraceae bacterium]
MSKDNKAVASINSGETFAIETSKPGIPDEVFTKDYRTEPFPTRILTITGPVFVNGAMPGDCLKISIENIELDNEGKMWMGQWMGVLMHQVDHCYMKNVKVEDGYVLLDEANKFPVRPMIGTIGTAPANEAIDCLSPGDHGGNMDSLSVTSGNTLYLPVNVEGALLSVGDVHAAMGYGEIFGTGVEIGSIVTLTVDVIKNKQLIHPIVETENSYIILVSSATFDEAAVEAANSAAKLFMELNACSFDVAYALAGQTADMRIEQIANPLVTLSMEIPKYMLKNILF